MYKCVLILQALKAVGLRHPAEVGAAQGRSFVPNDISLGGEAPGFVLLTGPNMGGKSTLLRQVIILPASIVTSPESQAGFYSD